MSAYSDWQQSVDGPEEPTPEDELSEFMGELVSSYMSVTELADNLGVSKSTVYRVQRTGKASAKTINAMRELWRDIAD